MQLPLPLSDLDRFGTTSMLSVLSAFLSPDLIHVTLHVSRFLSLALIIGTELILGPPQVVWTLCHLHPRACRECTMAPCLTHDLSIDRFVLLHSDS